MTELDLTAFTQELFNYGVNAVVEKYDAIIKGMSLQEVSQQIETVYGLILDEIDAGSMVKVDWETIHHFTPGCYGREFRIKAGSWIVGYIHHDEHFLFAMQGDVIIFSEQGCNLVSAPRMFVSKAGIQRVGFALTDIVWISTHATDETDVEKIEAQMFSLTIDEYRQKERILEEKPCQQQR
jgi:hypothetical protein